MIPEYLVNISSSNSSDLGNTSKSSQVSCRYGIVGKIRVELESLLPILFCMVEVLGEILV